MELSGRVREPKLTDRELRLLEILDPVAAHLQHVTRRNPWNGRVLPPFRPVAARRVATSELCEQRQLPARPLRVLNRTCVDRDAALFEKRDHPPLPIDERVNPSRLGVEEVGDRALLVERREGKGDFAEVFDIDPRRPHVSLIRASDPAKPRRHLTDEPR